MGVLTEPGANRYHNIYNIRDLWVIINLLSLR